ncbi:MAG: response regulator, partial [Actinomycetota bacterium]
LMTAFSGRGEEAPMDQPSHPQTEAPIERSSLRVLLAEDNAVNQQVALLLLGKLGYRADVAADGREVVEALERQPYDVVLMDVQMPEMDGLEATRRIHEGWGDRRPRIIAVTANATREDREACLAAGMDDYVSKPIQPEELAAALSRSIGGAPSVLDREGLERLRRTVGDGEPLAQIIEVFLVDADRLLGELAAAMAAGRADEVRRSAHTLKSTASSVGASSLAERCRLLEGRAGSGDLRGDDDPVEDIRSEYIRARDALRAVARAEAR